MIWIAVGVERKWTEKLGGVWTQRPPLSSPSLAIYSPYHHTYSMCISTVHYCCHRNVMHSVSYRLTQLNGIPCPICSGSFYPHLILKGHCKYSVKERRKEEREGEEEREKKGGWILPSAYSSTSLPILSLSLLLFSNVCSVRRRLNQWLSYTHIHYITHTSLYLPSFCDPPPKFAGGAFKGTGIVGIHYVVTKKKFYLRWYNHRMKCIAFIPNRSCLLTRSPMTYIFI